VFALLVGVLGLTEQASWRVAMLVVGAVCGLTGIAYYFLTQDAPEGSFSQLRSVGKLPSARQSWRDFLVACRDARVWALFIVYGACFGVELTVDNIAALYFSDYFGLGLMHSGFLAFLFGVLNVFGRALGGIFGDRFAGRWGLRGRVVWLFLVLFGEGLTLMLFSQMRVLAFAIPALLVFSLFMQMATGATYSVVPFINRKALGAVSGIVGAGGNAGAVAAALLFQGSMPWPTALLVLGFLVTVASTTSFAVRFTPETETEAHAQYWAAVQRRHGASPVPEPVGA
jgi:NNP family nitrate/nitrite transporter-like MFS transporter